MMNALAYAPVDVCAMRLLPRLTAPVLLLLTVALLAACAVVLVIGAGGLHPPAPPAHLLAPFRWGPNLTAIA